jgi:small subunit ribosomal protein S8
MMTDPIADMLTRIRNANTAFHDDVVMPSSKLKEALARILEREGYITGFAVEKDVTRPGQQLKIQMKYTGLRVYSNAQAVPRVLGGMGISILSTNQGLMTDREARERRVGGEILCQVW